MSLGAANKVAQLESDKTKQRHPLREKQIKQPASSSSSPYHHHEEGQECSSLRQIATTCRCSCHMHEHQQVVGSAEPSELGAVRLGNCDQAQFAADQSFAGHPVEPKQPGGFGGSVKLLPVDGCPPPAQVVAGSRQQQPDDVQCCGSKTAVGDKGQVVSSGGPTDAAQQNVQDAEPIGTSGTQNLPDLSRGRAADETETGTTQNEADHRQAPPMSSDEPEESPPNLNAHPADLSGAGQHNESSPPVGAGQDNRILGKL